MPYSRTSLVLVWLVLIGLVATAAMSSPSGLGLVAVVLMALVAPTLLLRA